MNMYGSMTCRSPSDIGIDAMYGSNFIVPGIEKAISITSAEVPEAVISGFVMGFTDISLPQYTMKNR